VILRGFFIGMLALSTGLCGQTSFILPLKEKVFLTGNYGEIRPNHFHAGLDFKTHPKKNLPIYSVADGYVSRIKVGTHGYGKVLYITHPGGKVSVYGHQYSFNDGIKKYVRAAQEARETFEVELFPKPDELKVKQGEVIGYTGNTGDSEGPHLHFEIRDDKSEVPLNPLRFVKIEDTVAPIIDAIFLYEDPFGKPQRYLPKDLKDPLNVPISFGMGLSCHDTEQKGGNWNNVYRTEMYIDDTLFYRAVLDSISFDLARYVNVYSDRQRAKLPGYYKVQKFFKGENNDLPIYKKIRQKGFIHLEDTFYHTIKLKVFDFYEQSAELSFSVKRVAAGRMKPLVKPPIDCLVEFKKEEDKYKIEIPAKALYADAAIIDSFYNDTLYVRNAQMSLLKSCTISMKPPVKLLRYFDKLCLVGPGAAYYGGEGKEGFIVGTTKSFGMFRVVPDTSAPKIKFVKPKSKKKKSYKTGDIISFQVSDDLSGIDKFKLYLNDKFYYAEYEHKTGLIFFELNDKTPKGKVRARLEVGDRKNNKKIMSQLMSIE